MLLQSLSFPSKPKVSGAFILLYRERLNYIHINHVGQKETACHYPAEPEELGAARDAGQMRATCLDPQNTARMLTVRPLISCSGPGQCVGPTGSAPRGSPLCYHQPRNHDSSISWMVYVYAVHKPVQFGCQVLFALKPAAKLQRLLTQL